MLVVSMIYEICFIAISLLMFAAVVCNIILLVLGKAPESTDDKLDKIVELLECLASEHLDVEAMKENQRRGYEALENARRVGADLHGGIVFCDQQRPDDYNEDKSDE